MPLARLTMDRFWADFSGGTSGASILATNLQLAFPTDPGIAALTTGAPPTVIPPGTPNIVVSTPNLGNLDTSTIYPIQRFTGIVVDASKSAFIANYTWCLQVPGSSTCAALPTGALTPTPSFDTTTPGAYVLQLSADNGLGVVKTAAFHFTVPDIIPTYVGAPPFTTPPTSPCPAALGASFDATNPSAQYPIDVSSCFNRPSGDETTQPFSLSITGPPSNQWTATVVPTVIAGAVPTINFAFTALASQDATVSYQLCDLDGECANGQTTVALIPGLKALAVSFHTYLQPSITPQVLPVGFTPTGTLSLVNLLQKDVISPADVVVTLTASDPTTSGRNERGGNFVAGFADYGRIGSCQRAGTDGVHLYAASLLDAAGPLCHLRYQRQQHCDVKRSLQPGHVHANLERHRRGVKFCDGHHRSTRIDLVLAGHESAGHEQANLWLSRKCLL